MNPYTQFLTDEASGLKMFNPRWEAWEEGKREGENNYNQLLATVCPPEAIEQFKQEGRREVVEWIENHAASWPLLLSDKVREWFKKAQQ
jgi:hypothetical protein